MPSLLATMVVVIVDIVCSCHHWALLFVIGVVVSEFLFHFQPRSSLSFSLFTDMLPQLLLLLQIICGCCFILFLFLFLLGIVPKTYEDSRL